MTDVTIYHQPSAELESNETFLEQPTIFSLNGRIGRLRYLGYSIVYSLVVVLVTAVIGAVFYTTFSAASGGLFYVYFSGIMYILGIIAATVILMRRRLHDLGHSGWFSLLMIVPFANLALGLYLTFAPGNPDTNQFGPAPTPNPSGLAPAILLGFGAMMVLSIISGFLN